MAIIKCPECGRQISDKAPVCPNCGVEIAGQITQCPYCGEIYLKSETICPHCHKTSGANTGRTVNSADRSDNVKPQQNVSTHTGAAEKPQTAAGVSNAMTSTGTPTDNGGDNNGKKNNKTTIIISIIIALIVVGFCFQRYYSAQGDKEQEEYEFAMRSDDPTILQTYLNNFKDAPQEHIDSITVHLQRLTAQDKEWNDALVSGSKNALTDYLKKYPDSPHKQEALDKIDSIDWAQCQKLNTTEAYLTYIENHADGQHYDEAEMAMKKLRSGEVSIEERELIANIFHNFFVSINSKDESGLTSTVGDIVNFLGKAGATKSDVISFMHKLYKSDVQNMIWTLSKDYNIQKKEIGDGMYEYSVSFLANQKVDKTDNTSKTNTFRISAKVDPDGKIVDFSMTKFVE